MTPTSALAAVLVSVLALGAVELARDGEGPASPDGRAAAQDETSEQEPRRSQARRARGRVIAVPAPRDGMPPRVRGHLVARVRAGSSLAVHDRPGGRVVGRVRDRTDIGSRNALAVLRTRGRWLGVATSERPDGRIGWIRADSRHIAYARTDRSIEIDLSERMLELREGRRVVARGPVGIGRPASPTPTGRFGVTDRLSGAGYGPYYGCCVIALSARQPHLPPGWRGGSRIAVHGTTSRSTIGARSSSGCLRAGEELLRVLMTEAPLGAPVTIRS